MPRHLAAAITDALALGALGAGPIAARRARWFFRFSTDFARMREDVRAVEGLVAEASGLERLDALREARRGFLLASAHLGNWELGAAIAARRGIPVTVVSERAPDAALDRWREETRSRYGVSTAYVGDPSLAPRILDALRAGGCVAMLVDREREPGAGAARIASAIGAPIVPAFVPFRADGLYAARVGDPVATAEALRAALRSAVDAWGDQWYPPPPERVAKGEERRAKGEDPHARRSSLLAPRSSLLSPALVQESTKIW